MIADIESIGLNLSGLQETLTKLGINSDSYKIGDGSGLSRQNLIKPQTLGQILQLMAENPDYRRYRDYKIRPTH